MNYEEVFYWIAVADSVKRMFDIFSNIFTVMAVISGIVYIIITGVKIINCPVTIKYDRDSTGAIMKDENGRQMCNTIEEPLFKTSRKITSFLFYFSLIFCFITWLGFVFTPTKRDAILIVAGGTTLNYLTQDSTAKAIPSEILTYLTAEIKSAAEQAKVELQDAKIRSTYKDELLNLSKDELINRLKTDSLARDLILK